MRSRKYKQGFLLRDSLILTIGGLLLIFVTSAAFAMPNMIGDWKGTAKTIAVNPTNSLFESSNEALTWHVTNQSGPFFWGTYTDQWGICEFVGLLASSPENVKINDCWGMWTGRIYENHMILWEQHLFDIGMSYWIGVKE